VQSKFEVRMGTRKPVIELRTRARRAACRRERDVVIAQELGRGDNVFREIRSPLNTAAKSRGNSPGLEVPAIAVC
jgi:hypothetical protein